MAESVAVPGTDNWLDQVERDQALQGLPDLLGGDRPRVDVSQGLHVELPADDTGHLQCRLLRHREAVEAPGDHLLDALGKVDLAQIVHLGGEPALPVLDDEQPGVTKGEPDLLAEVGVTSRPVPRSIR